MIWYRAQGQESAGRHLLLRLHSARISQKYSLVRRAENKLAAVREVKMMEHRREGRGGLAATGTAAMKPDRKDLER